MNDDPPKIDDLLARGEAAQFQFLQNDLDLCHTFVQIAHTEREIGDKNGIQQAREKAEKGYSTISRLMLHLDNPARQKEIQIRLDTLRVALDQLAARGDG